MKLIHLFFIFIFIITILEKVKLKPTLHILGLPHTEINTKFSVCAFTQKIRRLCRIATEIGYRAILYGNEGSETKCSEEVIIFTKKEREELYGKDEEGWMIGKQFNIHGIKPLATELYYNITIKKIKEKKQLHDFLLITYGWMHKPIADQLPDLIAIETGIGYPSPWAERRVYESSAWFHTNLGLQTKDRSKTIIPLWYQTVIPNCYYNDDFEPMNKNMAIIFKKNQTKINDLFKNKKEYYLFAGRIIDTKGISIAIDIVKKTNITLKIAGQGDVYKFLPKSDPLWSTNRVEYLGVLQPYERNKQLFFAKALIAPTYYIEPFGGIMVESMFLGTPVITTNRGAMFETIIDGKTGFRCSTMSCFIYAINQINKNNIATKEEVSKYARSKYHCRFVKNQYLDYFEEIELSLTKDAWYNTSKINYHPNKQTKTLSWD